MGILLLTILLTAFVPFTGFYFLFKRITPNKAPTSNPLFWVSSIFGAPLLLAGVVWVWFLISSQYPEREFDSSAWIENRETRYEYVDDLVNMDKAIGLQKSEIIERLGEPDNESDTSLTYYIGYTPKYFMNMNPDWLEIKLIDNVAIETSIVL